MGDGGVSVPRRWGCRSCRRSGGLHGLDGRRHGLSGSRSWSRVAWLGEEAEIESDQSRWSGVGVRNPGAEAVERPSRPSQESESKGSRRRWGSGSWRRASGRGRRFWAELMGAAAHGGGSARVWTRGERELR